MLLLSFATLIMLQAQLSKLYAADIKQIEFAADHPPYLEDFTMRTEQGNLIFSLRVANPFDHELKALLLNGVSQKIKLKITIKVNSFNLYLVKFNRELKKHKYIHRIKYDNLKKVFLVTLSDKSKPIETVSYKKAVDLATHFDSISLLSRQEIEPEHSYLVESRVVIRKAKLPFHLDYLFFFISAWDRKSSTYTIDIPERLISETLKR
jgi:uncharacterized membrane protein YgaE (UPF0421/DUF939 family)